MSYRDNSVAIEGTLRVWWVPQIPMEAFHRAVANPAEAAFLLGALAYYDMFQFENNVKPDYSNTGGLEIFHNGDWEEWESDEGDDIDAWAQNALNRN